MRKIKGIVGIILILLAIAGIIYWETIGRENVLYEEIIVFKENVVENKEVTKDLLKITKVEKQSLSKEVIVASNINEILGKRAKHFIPKNTKLVKEYFEEAKFSLEGGKKVFSIPTDWIYSYPQTIRRGDTLYFYPIRISQAEENVIGEPILKTTVYFVKDASNIEVTDFNTERLESSAVVNTIEVIITIDELNNLKQEVEKGMKFIILYD